MFVLASAATDASAIAQPYAIFARTEAYWQSARYPKQLSYGVVISVWENGKESSAHYHGAYDARTNSVRVAAVSDEEVAHPYVPLPGLATFREAHIPGADFLDLQGEFSDKATSLRFMMAPSPELEAGFSRHGIGERVRVVLYSIGSMMWAARFWWMLRSLGFDGAAILEGGFEAWRAEGRPVESGPPRRYPPAAFKAAPRPGFFVGRNDVLGALTDPGTVIINALAPRYHQGTEPSRYGRAGRIPNSVNVPAASLLNPDTRGFTSLQEARAKFEAHGVTKQKRVICYCGGGISATLNLLVLHQLGYPHLSLYDGSMGEWAQHHALPIETG